MFGFGCEDQGRSCDRRLRILLRSMPEDAAACSADKPPLRLVLFSARRTGSSLFVNLMRQHPRVLMHGEVRGACTPPPPALPLN